MKSGHYGMRWDPMLGGLTFLLIAFCLPAQETKIGMASQQFTQQHGTCAIAAQNGSNAALVVDSAEVTTLEGAGKQGPPVCKIAIVNREIAMVTTGLLESSLGFVRWNSKSHAEDILAKLPSNPQPEQIDAALQEWSTDLIRFINQHNAYSRKDGRVADLLVIWRMDLRFHVAKESVGILGGKPVRLNFDSYRHPLSPEGAGIYYSGSCRDYIRVAGGARGVEIDQDEVETISELGRLAKSLDISSAQQLAGVLVQIEKALTDVSTHHRENHSIEAVGPPFQVASISASGNWTPSFVPPCP